MIIAAADISSNSVAVIIAVPAAVAASLAVVTVWLHWWRHRPYRLFLVKWQAGSESLELRNGTGDWVDDVVVDLLHTDREPAPPPPPAGWSRDDMAFTARSGPFELARMRPQEPTERRVEISIPHQNAVVDRDERLALRWHTRPPPFLTHDMPAQMVRTRVNPAWADGPPDLLYQLAVPLLEANNAGLLAVLGEVQVSFTDSSGKRWSKSSDGSHHRLKTAAHPRERAAQPAAGSRPERIRAAGAESGVELTWDPDSGTAGIRNHSRAWLCSPQLRLVLTADLDVVPRPFGWDPADLDLQASETSLGNTPFDIPPMPGGDRGLGVRLDVTARSNPPPEPLVRRGSTWTPTADSESSTSRGPETDEDMDGLSADQDTSAPADNEELPASPREAYEQLVRRLGPNPLAFHDIGNPFGHLGWPTARALLVDHIALEFIRDGRRERMTVAADAPNAPEPDPSRRPDPPTFLAPRNRK